jgi:hypothetical protein
MPKTFYNRVGALTINNDFMNKVKMFFVAAALVLTTVGVFAGSAKFGNTLPNFFLYNTSTGYLPEHSSTLSGTYLYYDATNPGITPGTLSYGSSLTYGVYAKIGTTYYGIYW